MIHRPALDNATSASAFLGEPGDVAGAGLIMDLQGQRALLPPVPVPLPAGDVQSRLLCSAAASTSGRPTASVAPVSQGLLSHLYRHGVEIDALVRIEVR
jgi:E3 ubiquitin-protein ligase BOI-like protein